MLSPSHTVSLTVHEVDLLCQAKDGQRRKLKSSQLQNIKKTFNIFELSDGHIKHKIWKNHFNHVQFSSFNASRNRLFGPSLPTDMRVTADHVIIYSAPGASGYFFTIFSNKKQISCVNSCLFKVNSNIPRSVKCCIYIAPFPCNMLKGVLQ